MLGSVDSAEDLASMYTAWDGYNTSDGYNESDKKNTWDGYNTSDGSTASDKKLDEKGNEDSKTGLTAIILVPAYAPTSNDDVDVNNSSNNYSDDLYMFQ